MQYARIANSAVESILNLDPAYVEKLAPNKRALLLPFVIDPQPTPTASQVVSQGPYAIELTQVRQTWALREKTAAELSAEADAAERDQLKAAAIMDLLRAEAAGTSTLTAAQSRKLFARCVLFLVNRQ
jgi:hypothetical protein